MRRRGRSGCHISGHPHVNGACGTSNERYEHGNENNPPPKKDKQTAQQGASHVFFIFSIHARPHGVSGTHRQTCEMPSRQTHRQGGKKGKKKSQWLSVPPLLLLWSHHGPDRLESGLTRLFIGNQNVRSSVQLCVGSFFFFFKLFSLPACNDKLATLASVVVAQARTKRGTQGKQVNSEGRRL